MLYAIVQARLLAQQLFGWRATSPFIILNSASRNFVRSSAMLARHILPVTSDEILAWCCIALHEMLQLIVPKGRIEDLPTPKIKIFSFVFVVNGCLPSLCNILTLRNTFSILIQYFL